MTTTSHIQTAGRPRLVLVVAALAVSLGLLAAAPAAGAASSSGRSLVGQVSALPNPAGGCGSGC